MTKAELANNECLIRPFPRLAIVGASARAATGSVYLSGRTATTADLFADADLLRLCNAERVGDYPGGLYDWLQRSECDAWFYTGALENQPDLVDRLAQLRPLMGNNGETLRRVRDPLLLQQLMQQYDLPFPATRLATEGPTDQGRWLAKTYQGSSGMGTSDWQGNSSGYVQRWINGQFGSALFAGSTLLGISRQLVGESWTGAAKFQYAGSLAPWLVPAPVEQQILSVGELLYAEFELQGLFGVDFVFDGQDAWLLEVNPRYIASVEVLELANSFQAIDWHLSTCKVSGLDPLEPLQPSEISTVLGKAIWFTQERLQVTAANSDWALSQLDLADVPVPGTIIDIGYPVLTVRAEAWTDQELVATMQQRIAEVAARFTGE